MNCPRLEAIAVQSRVLMALLALMLAGATVFGFGAKARPHSSAEKRVSFSPPRTAIKQNAFANLPLVFESNQGQSDSEVKFLSRGSGYGLFLTANQAVLTLQHSALSTQRSAGEVSVVRMALDGSNANSRPCRNGSLARQK